MIETMFMCMSCSVISYHDIMMDTDHDAREDACVSTNENENVMKKCGGIGQHRTVLLHRFEHATYKSTYDFHDVV
jgi:hypothetical protein